MKINMPTPTFTAISPRYYRACRGVGLIEVMIAIIVVSIGILAVIGMQVTGKQANYDAVQRTTAAHLAYDMIERMRANPSALGAYAAAGVLGNGSLSAPGQSCSSTGTACSPAQMAAMDLYEWERAMDGAGELRDVNDDGDLTDPEDQTGGLVLPRACISGPAGGAGVYEIVLVWRGTQEQSTVPLGNARCGGGLDSSGVYGTGDRLRRQLRITFFVTA
jgi:type IV pilus assembly protein PilV